MARFKSLAKKLRLAKRKTQTRWAPIWIIPRIYSKGRRVHPSKHTHVKRHWKSRGAKIKS